MDGVTIKLKTPHFDSDTCKKDVNPSGSQTKHDSTM